MFYPNHELQGHLVSLLPVWMSCISGVWCAVALLLAWMRVKDPVQHTSIFAFGQG